ncbi:hypothetical protein M5K25_009876 [Dendrobium thyrsiflorum]|uniref:Disease resistance protein n=1 Tax=Dendrobium thyrsiflorum TaxID=117978 RepID=A0ABD0V6T9_DENTH
MSGTTLYMNISLLSIEGNGESLQICWNLLKNKRPHLELLHEFQGSLKSELMFKKFLFVLNDIWEKEEEKDKKDKNILRNIKKVKEELDKEDGKHSNESMWLSSKCSRTAGMFCNSRSSGTTRTHKILSEERLVNEEGRDCRDVSLIKFSSRRYKDLRKGSHPKGGRVCHSKQQSNWMCSRLEIRWSSFIQIADLAPIRPPVALEDWFEAGVAAEDGWMFPCLIELELINCPKLKKLPHFPPKLKSLKIGIMSISNSIPLETLEVSRCRNITTLPLVDEIARLVALRYLKIKNCPNLISFGRHQEVQTTNSCYLKLENIELNSCSEWETLPVFGQLPFLKYLKLHDMPKVKWLESKFNGNDKCRAFPLLEVLDISGLEALEDCFEAGVHNCPKLKELPSMPSKLKRLGIKKVSDCPNIISLLLADEIARLAALRHLTIVNCANLISLERYREVETTNNCHLMLSDLRISDPPV